jgi:hypothetical protein
LGDGSGEGIGYGGRRERGLCFDRDWRGAGLEAEVRRRMVTDVRE